ncbi:MAG: hypothetical protein M3Y56_16815 [Armatimonadota bacterium]|nr:hypothetical protein [Armatimonadota bacterium]
MDFATEAAGESALATLGEHSSGTFEPVQVWKLRPPVLSYGAAVASALGLFVVCLVIFMGAVNDHGRWAGGWIHLAIIIGNIFLWLNLAGGIHLFHVPSYVAADARGIAFRTLRRWRAVAWTEIVWAEFGPMVNQVRLSSGKVIPIRFITLRDEALPEIQSLIVLRAELTCKDRRGRGYMYRRCDPFLDT